MTITNNIYSQIAQKIVDDLERAELALCKLWNNQTHTDHALQPLHYNGIPYTGINTIMLRATAAEKGYASPYWMTFQEAAVLNGHVYKGARGVSIVCADTFEQEETRANGTTAIRQIPFPRIYTVFNADQIKGLPETFYKIPTSKK